MTLRDPMDYTVHGILLHCRRILYRLSYQGSSIVRAKCKPLAIAFWLLHKGVASSPWTLVLSSQTRVGSSLALPGLVWIHVPGPCEAGPRSPRYSVSVSSCRCHQRTEKASCVRLPGKQTLRLSFACRRVDRRHPREQHLPSGEGSWTEWMERLKHWRGSKKGHSLSAESSRAKMGPQVMMNPGKGAGPFYVMSTAHWMRAVPGRSSDLRQGYFLLLRATPQQGPSCEPPAASTRCSWGKELFSPKRGFWVVYPSIHHERGVAVFLCRVLFLGWPRAVVTDGENLQRCPLRGGFWEGKV